MQVRPHLQLLVPATVPAAFPPRRFTLLLPTTPHTVAQLSSSLSLPECAAFPPSAATLLPVLKNYGIQDVELYKALESETVTHLESWGRLLESHAAVSRLAHFHGRTPPGRRRSYIHLQERQWSRVEAAEVRQQL